MDWFGGKTAVATGAAHGIGAGIATRLASLGASVIALDKDGPALEERFRSAAGVTVWHGDMAGDAGALADTICNRFGPVQLVVNNVGIDTPHTFLELDEDDFELVFRTNLRGPWFFTKRLVAELVANDLNGSVLFITSLHDRFIRLRPHYSASKAAVAMLVKELAHELGPHGIRVNAVSPGVVRSASVPAAGPESAERTRRLLPLGRIGEANDVSQVAMMLLSDEWSGYVTGANVPVDGGLSLHSWSADPE